MPWNDTQWRMRTPMAAILSSRALPSGSGGLSGRATQTPTRPARRSAVTLKRARVRMVHSSRSETKRRTSWRRAAQVEHGVDHALAGAVIGVLPAAARDVDGKAHGLQEVLRPGAGAGGVERRMLQQPDQLALAARADVGHALFHDRQCLGVGHRAVRNAPLQLVHCGKIGTSGPERNSRGVAPSRYSAELPCHCGAYLVSPAPSNRRGHGGIGRRASLRC